MDGVFADMDAGLVRQAEVLFGEAPVAQDTVPSPEQLDANSRPRAPEHEAALARLRISARQQRKLWEHVESIDGFWETLKEIEPGSVRKLAGLAGARGWEVIFLTKRPRSAGATAQVQTQRWLQTNGFPFPSVFVVQGSRGRIASSLDLDFVIDDRPENCLDVVMDSKAQAILVWRQRDTQMLGATKRLGIGVVTSVMECLDVLAQVDSPELERPSIVDRVMRLLGMRPAAKGTR